MQQPDYPERFQAWPELMTTQDVADALGVSFDAASRVMAQPDFPLVVPGLKRNRKVNKHRFLTWMRTGE